MKSLPMLTAFGSSMNGGGGGRKGKKKSKIIAKFFNIAAGRPFPSMGSLEQGITVQMEVSTSGILNTSTTINTFAALQFSLNNCQGYTSYTALFDQYKIDEIEVWIEPQAAAGSAVFGAVYTAVDLDDAVTPTSIANVAAKQGALCGEGAAGRYHKWVPHLAVAGQTVTNLMNFPSQWIDSAFTGVLHFGFKMAAAPTPAAILAYVYTVRMKVSFKGPGLQ